MKESKHNVVLLRRDCQQIILKKAGYTLDDLKEIAAPSSISQYFSYKLPFKAHNLANRIDEHIIKYQLHKKHLPDYQPLVRKNDNYGSI